MATELTLPNGKTELATVGDNPVLVYLAGLRTYHSRRTMRQSLGLVAGLLSGTIDEGGNYYTDPEPYPWSELDAQHVTMVRSWLAENYKRATANKVLSALRGVLKAAFELGQMSAEQYQRAKLVKGLKGKTLPAGRSIAGGELGALLNVCDMSPVGVRDAAIISLLYSCGLRRAELVGLDLSDFDPVAGTLFIQGKGDKDRLAHLVNGAAEAFGDWLAVRGGDPGPLFVPAVKGGSLRLGDRLTAQAVYKMLLTRAKKAGVKDLSPHDFRRTFVGDLLDAGVDISTVQQLAGHADVSTTQRYDRRPEAARRKAAQSLHVPYRRRVIR
jgi:site-specific recombinase XerD